MDLLQVIDERIAEKFSRINTIDLAKVTEVKPDKLRCNVKLKHKVAGNEVELFDIPVAFTKFAGSVIAITPGVDDVVLIAFSKYELDGLIANDNSVDVNEAYRFGLNEAIIIAGIYTEVDEFPEIKEEELMIKHNSGAGFFIDKEGNVTIKAKSITEKKL